MINIAVLYGHGLNCDRETKFVLEKAAKKKNFKTIQVNRIHISKLIRKKTNLNDFEMLTIPGGFLHGDDISAGKILANKLRTHLSQEIENFIMKKKLILGICNGFQVLVKYPLLPSPESHQKVTLTFNDSGRFLDTWIWIKTNGASSPFFKGIDQLYLPIRHAEGKFIAPKKTIAHLEQQDQIVLKYCKPNGEKANGEFPYNPNGSLYDIAGICDKTGRICGIMPHPEAFMYYYNRPNWELLKRKREKVPDYGAGGKVFENALAYLTKHFS